MTSHHPSETILWAHVAGSLPPAHRQVIAIHVALCPRCAAEVRNLEEIGGALLDDLTPVPLETGSFTRLMARLDEPVPPPRPAMASPPLHRRPGFFPPWPPAGGGGQGPGSP